MTQVTLSVENVQEFDTGLVEVRYLPEGGQAPVRAPVRESDITVDDEKNSITVTLDVLTTSLVISVKDKEGSGTSRVNELTVIGCFKERGE